MSDNVKELSLRIERIEKMIEGIAIERAPVKSDLTKEEIKAFRKVSDMVAVDFGHFCGINDCFRCIVVRCQSICQVVCDNICNPCDVECSCGPCGLGGGLRGRVNRFGGMGQ